MPMGGIGTGCVSLGGRGDLRDWEIMNRPAKGYTPDGCFFALRAKPAGGETTGRVIEGVIPEEQYEGASGSPAPNHGFPRFRNTSFTAAFPFGQVMLSDHDVPVDVRVEAFSPLVPADADASGIPLAVMRFALVNKTDRRVDATVCGNLMNFIGADGRQGKADRNRNRFRKPTKASKVYGLFMDSQGVAPESEQWGTMALATTATSGVSHRTSWLPPKWGNSKLDFWEDLMEDGRLDDRRPRKGQPHVHNPQTSLAVSMRVPPRAEKSVTFLVAWHFPNRREWKVGPRFGEPARVGAYYATQYRDAWDVVKKTAPRLRQLERDTLAFVHAFCDSDLPQAVKEGALNNISTLRTQTCFRIESGHFMGWEGCRDNSGCCAGSCTHVWNYEQTTAFLFGELATTMRDVEFGHATKDDGFMPFRAPLPLDGDSIFSAAADGQMGCLMKLYRDWQLSGDDEMLRRLWPQARKALEFAWIEGGWDADRDGVMEGCQHNTMDVEYYGPNPQMASWYLGALRASEEMARYLGDDAFAETCIDLFERGRDWIDANLFNGEYYEHEIRPAKAKDIAPNLRMRMGANDSTSPDFQLGVGCLVDQLVGQFLAHVCGLGYLLDRRHVAKTLRSIMKHNFKRFDGHFNCMRSYVLNDEQALLMASYPRGERPQFPFPYFTEVMTGFEYTAAIGMLYEGQVDAGLKAIAAIRDRYDGRKRSPFNEAECGHHYARAMAAWAAVLALTGFDYSAVTGTMRFAAKDGLHFWSTGYGYGTCHQKSTRNGMKVELRVIGGKVLLRDLVLTGVGETRLGRTRQLKAGQKVRLGVS